MMSKEEVSRCPICHSDSVAEILYGLPNFNDRDLIEALDAGKYVLAGCDIMEINPRFECNACKHQWGQIDIDSD
ncbi:hypothetical protein [Orrella sp. 11846]|uniref:hypothetical protein n=1 Tax=Orrella sp. 11846 TaxID=3409913 RepID=UPI003B59919F